jgi:outer membrane protein assembly factor BamA
MHDQGYLCCPNLKILLVCFGLFLGCTPAHGQNFIKRYLNNLVSDTLPPEKPKFLIYPTLGFAPETSLEIGLSSVYLYYAKEDTLNRLSEFKPFVFFTLRRQYGFWFDHALYTDKNRWFIAGKARYQRYPLLYFGIGPGSPADPVAQVNADYLLFNERVLRELAPSLYAGLEVDFQRLFRVGFVPEDGAPTFDLPTGAEGSLNIGLGGALVLDTRHNVLNVRNGAFAELSFLHSDPVWGSKYRFSALISDNRWYKSINRRDVLALQVYGRFSAGNVPFQQLSLMGGESTMRGYYLGRYRDKNLLAAQAEYRMLPLPFRNVKRWGAAFFMGTGTVFSEDDPLSPENFVWAGGAGLRFLIFPEKDIFTRLDVAFTREGPGFYIFIGEAF